VSDLSAQRLVSADVEADEVLLVLAGAGRVVLEDGSALDLRPGVLVRLHEGDRTTCEMARP
jgi:uncharacterized cupin superfamily protein